MFRCTGLSRRLLGLVLVVVPCQFCGCSGLCVLCADALCSPQGPSALDLPPGPTPAPSPAPSPVIWPLPSSDPNPSSGVAHTVCHRPQGRGDAFALSIYRSVGVRPLCPGPFLFWRLTQRLTPRQDLAKSEHGSGAALSML